MTTTEPWRGLGAGRRDPVARAELVSCSKGSRIRLSPRAWGHGHATELGSAGIAAAHPADVSVAVIAWVLAHNDRSRRVAERLGLSNEGLRVDPSDGRARVAFDWKLSAG